MKIEFIESDEHYETTSYDLPIPLKELHDMIDDPLFLRINSRCLEFILIEKYINILNNIENYIKNSKHNFKILKKVYVEK